VKLLLHICCAPCAIYPVSRLRAQGIQTTGYFYRSNIHPFQECQRRHQTLVAWSEQAGLPLISAKEYDLQGFLRQIVFRETERCRICYHLRLTATAHIARHGGFDAFSSTLLYSRYQRHDVIQATGEAVAREVGVEFHYADYRPGWQEGVEASRRLNLYRQPYCGCVYSEMERYAGRGAAGATHRVR
jgi:hypothetical protein